MKKVLFFIHDLGYGGAEKVLVNLANNLDKNKFSITIISLFGGGINEKYLDSRVNHIKIFNREFPANSRILKLFSPKLLHKLFVKDFYDIEISYLEGVPIRVISGCNDSRVKKINWIHCKMDKMYFSSAGMNGYNDAVKCYNKFDYTVCVSKWVKKSFIKLFNYNNPVEVLYNTIETDEIIAKSDEPIDDITFDKEAFNIISVGKIIAVKAFMRLARIHKKLLDDGIRNRVYILGIGDEKPKIEKYLVENNLTDTFKLLGYNTNPYKYVKACDLYVCSSLSEGFSTSVTESLIVGTPVVTTLCSGMQEMLGENNEYGIVTENNEEALYEGIKKILTTPGMLQKYAAKALERGKEFSTEKTTKAVEKMLLSL